MTRNKIFALLAVSFSMLLASQALLAADMQMPAADGKAFWEYISKTDDYKNWETWPGYPDMYPGKSPHGAFLKVYGNKAAIEAAKAGNPMPDGAIVVKENYGKDKTTLMAITPMYKVKGFNPEGGDWFWAKYGPDGEDMASGKVQGCIDCHARVKGADWIFTKKK